jgi:hypothetical protein
MAEGAVRPVVVVVLLEGAEDGRRVLLVEDEDVVEEFAADGADEAGDPAVDGTPPRRTRLLIGSRFAVTGVEHPAAMVAGTNLRASRCDVLTPHAARAYTELAGTGSVDETGRRQLR